MPLPRITSNIPFVMKKILLLVALSFSLCACAYYPPVAVGPDGGAIVPVGYGNPYCYGTSGSYGGGYYPVYGGCGYGGYGVYGGYGWGGFGYANNTGNTTVNINKTSTYNGGNTTINRTIYNGGTRSYTGSTSYTGTRNYSGGSYGGARNYGGYSGGMRSYGGGSYNGRH